MSIIRGVNDDIKAAKRIWLPWWVVLCWMAVCALIVWPLVEFGRFDLATPILNCIGVLGFAIAFKRKLMRCAWFWITMTIIAGLHVPLILFVPWTTKWIPALAIAGIDSLDFCLILWILAIVGRLASGPKASET